MSNVTFLKRKVYPDKTEKLILKNGNAYLLPRKKSKTKRQQQIEFLNTQLKLLDIKHYLNKHPSLFDIEKYNNERKLILDKIDLVTNTRDYLTAYRSMLRSKKELIDILKSNDFDYFLTLTFDKNKLDRLDDKLTMKSLKNWIDYNRKQYPDMCYVAVPEYHKKGGLHFHILIGGMTEYQLKLTNSGKLTKNCKYSGETIYNVNAWNNGYSTATKIINKDAVKFYLSKYLTKQKIDPRFFRKKRYFTSHNITKPLIQKTTYPLNTSFDIKDSIDFNDYTIEYEDKQKQYLILTRTLD